MVPNSIELFQAKLHHLGLFLYTENVYASESALWRSFRYEMWECKVVCTCSSIANDKHRMSHMKKLL